MPVKKGGTFIVGDDVRRFWSKTRTQGACVVWTGGKDKDGYGKFMVGPAGRQKTMRPHRWLYTLVVGVLGSRYLLHSCDQPACVALQHLSPGTQRQNVADCIAKGRKGKGSAKVSVRDVASIKYLHAHGVSLTALAEQFDLTKSGVFAITSGRNWSNVQPKKP